VNGEEDEMEGKNFALVAIFAPADGEIESEDGGDEEGGPES
jgi:hypothetical protein